MTLGGVTCAVFAHGDVPARNIDHQAHSLMRSVLPVSAPMGQRQALSDWPSRANRYAVVIPLCGADDADVSVVRSDNFDSSGTGGVSIPTVFVPVLVSMLF